MVPEHEEGLKRGGGIPACLPAGLPACLHMFFLLSVAAAVSVLVPWIAGPLLLSCQPVEDTSREAEDEIASGVKWGEVHTAH